MRRRVLEPPRLCSLPPTSAAFQQNLLRAHYQTSIWLNALNSDPPKFDPLTHGWSLKQGSRPMHMPTHLPDGTIMAPAHLIKVIKCSCGSTSICSTKRCSCKSTGLKCTLFCLCQGNDTCHNKQFVSYKSKRSTSLLGSFVFH